MRGLITRTTTLITVRCKVYDEKKSKLTTLDVPTYEHNETLALKKAMRNIPEGFKYVAVAEYIHDKGTYDMTIKDFVKNAKRREETKE